MKKSYELDMCNGPILGKILVFAIPLMISGILQLLFNAADIIVVGRFTGSQALAAVGSTSALINLIINLFIGVSVGANVVVARNYGAKDYDGIHGAVHTSVLTAIWGGIILIFVGPGRCHRPVGSVYAHLLCRNARFYDVQLRRCHPACHR